MPENVERYVLRAPLGRRGGAVFAAEDRQLDRMVAVKLLALPLLGEEGGAERLARIRRGAREAAGLSHPYIVPVLDYAEAGDRAWIVMELAGGLPLRDVLDRGERFTPSVILRLMEQILSALEHAHGRGVAHGKLTPDNIMIVPDPSPRQPTARLTDFGIPAFRDRPPPATKPPAEPSAEADLLAAAAILHELVTGERLAANPSGRLSGRRVPVPPPFDAVLARATADDPALRYASAADFAAALRALRPSAGPLPAAAAGEAGPGPAPSAPPRAPVAEPRRARPVVEDYERRRRLPARWPLALGGALGLAALAGLGLFLREGGDDAPAEPAPIAAAAPAPVAGSFRGAAEAALRTGCSLLEAEADERHLVLRGLVRRDGAEALRRRIEGFRLPPGSVRLELREFEADFCGLIDTVRPAAVRGEAAPQLVLESPDPIPAGQALRFRVRMPAREAYLHVYFFSSDGKVGNMAQSVEPLPPGVTRAFGEPYWTSAEPYGTGLLVAVASDTPLYPGRRGIIEQSFDAVSALGYAIEMAKQRGERVEMRVVPVTSVPPR
ncbi:serine/threonine protein kinase [Muricoccus pecuniae]|uniref:Serine/threonine-protein kinase n=1 Tax=Muricoccus pecuniae TaxID=693023 RepID=A0A840Y8W1_9PROT|nr:serine/threonine protein kinase [Roseomonas pecuniae]MBB5695179.1 serine/threonine-protein kinase [Roseomonas pecuniae]